MRKSGDQWMSDPSVNALIIEAEGSSILDTAIDGTLRTSFSALL
jgi:hypothetical protein